MKIIIEPVENLSNVLDLHLRGERTLTSEVNILSPIMSFCWTISLFLTSFSGCFYKFHFISLHIFYEDCRKVTYILVKAALLREYYNY